jgi:hypothetical protein
VSRLWDGANERDSLQPATFANRCGASYKSQRYLETGDLLHALFGNAPSIVNRHTGDPRVTGTTNRIEYFIEEHEHELARR